MKKQEYIKKLFEKKQNGTLNSIDIASGTLLYPDSHKILDLGNSPLDCHHASILFCRNAEKFNVPYYVFWHNFNSLTFPKDYAEYILEEYGKIFPRYYELLQKESSLGKYPNVITISKEQFNIEYDEYIKAPEFGFYKIPHESNLPDELKDYRLPPDESIIISK